MEFVKLINSVGLQVNPPLNLTFSGAEVARCPESSWMCWLSTPQKNITWFPLFDFFKTCGFHLLSANSSPAWGCSWGYRVLQPWEIQPHKLGPMGPIELKLYTHFYWNCASKCHGTEANGQHIFQFFLHLLTPRQAPILAASGGYGTVPCKAMFWWHGA